MDWIVHLTVVLYQSNYTQPKYHKKKEKKTLVGPLSLSQILISRARKLGSGQGLDKIQDNGS